MKSRDLLVVSLGTMRLCTFDGMFTTSQSRVTILLHRPCLYYIYVDLIHGLCACVCVCVYIHAHLSACVCVCVHAFVYVQCMFVYVCMCVYVLVCVCVCVCVLVCVLAWVALRAYVDR